MTFAPTVLAESLSETAGYKAGVALSVPDLCEHLCEPDTVELIELSERGHVRIRSEDYDSLFYRLLHRIGHTAEEFDGDLAGTRLFHRYKEKYRREYEGVTQIFVEVWPRLADAARESVSQSIDPSEIIRAASDQLGEIGLEIAMERLRAIDRGMRLSPHSGLRYVEWKSRLALEALFQRADSAPEVGRFIDQRFVDYLFANEAKLSEMHWRKFEELTAEYFHREGYEVELGPGSNDDGVDVRVWASGRARADGPLLIVQCKRQTAKIEKIIVKGLYADVLHEGAKYGLIVTTSELSRGARNTITARGYPVREVERDGISAWLKVLRTPGTGIIRV